MPTSDLCREIKNTLDRLPRERLESVADFVKFLNRPLIAPRMERAARAIATGKGVNWRKVVPKETK